MKIHIPQQHVHNKITFIKNLVQTELKVDIEISIAELIFN